MKLAVGLGNPGIEYQFTWHNLGFLVVDRLAERFQVPVENRRCRALTGKVRIGAEDVLLAKPETYVNLSGLAVRELLAELELDPGSALVVIHDELDLPLGAIRVRERGGSAGHNGLESIMNALGTQEFVRVRIGIRPDFPVEDGARFVLSQIRKPQYETVDRILDEAADAVESLFREGPAATMNRFNRRKEEPEK
jgi:PTH1 family peptidyl-tRNA hydrolase